MGCITQRATQLPFFNPVDFHPERSFDISTLQEKDLAAFFEFHDETKTTQLAGSSNIETQVTQSKSTDFIHFIWMGNPIKDSDKNTILSWKRCYPQQQIVIWVDKKALQHRDIIDFAIENNIKLIDIEKIFLDQYTFDLAEFIQLEKNRLPTNWGAISDIYRYLIMYYFAGTYSDTDSLIEKNDTVLDFDKDMAFSPNFEEDYRPFPNDRLMTKNIRNDFWPQVFVEIKRRYQTEQTFGLSLRTNRLNFTLRRTGPDVLRYCLNQYIASKENIQFIDYNYANGNFSWRGQLTDEQCERLSKEEDIVRRIVDNIIINLKEKKSLDLQKYDNIVDKIPTIQREHILGHVKAEIKKLDVKDLKVINIYAKNSREFEEFSLLFELRELYPVDLSIIDRSNIKKALMKAAKRKNLEMFKYLFKKYPQALFCLGLSSYMIKLILQFVDKEILVSILNYAKTHNREIDLYNLYQNQAYIDLDLALDFFEKIKKFAPEFLKDYKLLPDSLHKILLGIMHKHNKDKLEKLIKLLNIIPLEMLTEKDSYNRNILQLAIRPCFGLKKAIAIIKYFIFKRKKRSVWIQLLSDIPMTWERIEVNSASKITKEITQLFETANNPSESVPATKPAIKLQLEEPATLLSRIVRIWSALNQYIEDNFTYYDK